MSTKFQPRAAPHHQKRRYGAAAPPPLPPIEPVTFVYRYDENNVLFYFEDDVASVDGPCLGLKVGGRSPVSVGIFDPNVLMVMYDAILGAGETWQIVADEVQVTFDPPHRLIDGTGEVAD